MERERLVPLVDEGLGNSAYLLDVGDGRALAVDPPRDLRALRAAAGKRRLTVAWAADTHLHADFLSGAVQLAATDGAQILASAAGMRAFEHRGLTDGDEVDLGGLTLRALATPGHTDEHLTFLLLDGPTPVGVFTGGSLIVGSAARTDLLGEDRTVELARAQYASLHRLAALPDATGVWPTHGAGSFCSAPPGAARTSTIGAEKAGNPLLAAPDADAFVDRLVASLGSYPAYFRWLAEANRRGPAVVNGLPHLPGLSAAEVRRFLADGAVVVDVRPVPDVAAGHIPGAIAIPLRAQFATWLGWLVDPGTPVMIVRNGDQDPADILWPALNIGVDHLVGELTGGMAAWTGEVTTTRLVRPDQVDAPVLDIRQAGEYTAGHLPHAVHLELGDLPATAHAAPHGPVVVMCGHGERAMTAATLLERTGRHDLAVLVGGAEDWATATGRRLQEGS
ncbi:rhodanese-like domain-containing protein [Micromonospora sp. NBC_00858]|uniref:rhodanese-like domain-containing protein n=1 Tax=Micromonospora sp. NBC_00858 TaxID=2975979 RepID=UPI003863CFC3|nr:rhodanese-like domain-containing protein [Micromonospora sp. NBC_00858]